MQFVTVTVSGSAPRSFWSEAPGPAAIQTAIANIFQSDGFTVQSLKVQASETGLFSGANPYSVTITMVAADGQDPQVVAQTIGQEIGKALGQVVDTIGAPTTSASPTAPDAVAAGSGFPWLDNLASSFNTDVQFVVVGLVVLAAFAFVILSPELKRAVAA